MTDKVLVVIEISLDRFVTIFLETSFLRRSSKSYFGESPDPNPPLSPLKLKGELGIIVRKLFG